VNCLDAETLAAWFDDGLKGAALEDVRAHVAGCDRCQMLLGAMGRTRAAVPGPAAERAASFAKASEPGPRRWLAWAVPLAAAATAIAVWVAIPEQRNVPVVAPATAPELKQEAPAAAPPPVSAAAPPAAGDTRQANPRANLQAPPTERSQANGAAPATPPAAAPAAEPSAAAPLVAPRPEARVLDQQQRAAKQAPPNESITTTAEKATVPSIESLCGRRWSSSPDEVIGALTAGSSPVPSVCWVVGRGGVVRLSTDGQTWQRIPFPEMTDLSGVQSSDARSATVSTADGRSFRTADGGMTWIPQ
jgi:hypothetical protein